MRFKSLIVATLLACAGLVPNAAHAEWKDTPCGPNGFLIGLNARGGVWVDRIQAVCGVWNPATARIESTFTGNLLATSSGGSPMLPAMCPTGTAVTGIEADLPLNKGIRVAENVRLTCGNLIAPHTEVVFRPRIPTTGSGKDDNMPSGFSEAVGWFTGQGFVPFIAKGETGGTCDPGTVATVFHADADEYVGALGIECGLWPDVRPASATPLPPAPAGAKSGTDRPGSDFKSYALNDPTSCQAKCQADGACKAWTWAAPGTNGAAAATCYLKNPAPAEVAANCCISGLPTALPPAQGGAKTGVDLPGSDFFSFTSNDQNNCALSCAKDARCKAWTWAVAGTNGAKYATCYLKNAVPKEVANNCCVSGLPPTGGGLSSTGGAVTLPPGALSGTDRPGGDIAAAPSPNPTSCAQTCGANGACKAWTWAVAGTSGQSVAFCYQKNVVPKATANNCCVSGLAPAAGGIPTGGGFPSVPAGAQANTDRPGGDVNAIPSGDPTSCAQSCSVSAICRAWTWALAGTNGSPQPRCYLKSIVPAPQPNPCCVSGLKTAGGGTSSGGAGLPPGSGVPPGATPGADRPGGDFAAAPSPNPANCAQACGNSPACKAWTWAVPGTNGQPGAICYLKNVVPPQQASPCCVSGTKGGGSSGSGGSGGSGSGPDFSGNWHTTINGSAPGMLTLFKAGGNWQGTYFALGISGAISNGHIGSDGHLRFSWSQPGATGKGNFVLTGPSGFSGTFYFDANPGAVGSWSGHR